MRLIRREDLEEFQLPGRIIQRAVGKDGFSRSTRMTVGFARHSGTTGHEPHHHAEEFVYILSARNSRVRYGPSVDRLGSPLAVEGGMMLHFPDLEWHVFDVGHEGYVDALFFYGQVDNIRPEDMIKGQDIKRA
jgi:hypothetical protein